MSWFDDVHDMHTKYGFRDPIADFDDEKLGELLKFRISCLDEEMSELKLAAEIGDAEGIVDALVDLCVFAIGTLDQFHVDGQLAWNEVHLANMTKEKGIKPERPNPFGFPDLIKPEGWIAPSHDGNHGVLARISDSS